MRDTIGDLSTALSLAAGPLLFLVAIVGGAVLLGVRGVPAERIPERIGAFASSVLLGVLSALSLLLLLRHPEAVRSAWTLPPASDVIVEAATGLVVGTLIGIAYIAFLANWLTRAQRSIGDYVPPGEVLSTISGSLVPFFVANVVLAPLVEETLYRGIAIPSLAAGHGTGTAVVISSIAFALLHWAGGLWYMVLTGSLLGGVLSALFLWHGSLVAPYAAHLALNVVEFGWALHLRRSARR